MDVVKRTAPPGQPLPRERPRPLVIAHRGASDEEPEHTLRAYRKAFEHGADGVECDVRLTADHHLVCVHDRRVDRTSERRRRRLRARAGPPRGVRLGLVEARRPPGRHRVARVRPRARAPAHPAPPARHPRRHRARRSSPSSRPSTRPGTATTSRRPSCRCCARSTSPTATSPGRPHVRMMSFSNRALQRAHKLAPRLPLVYLVDATMPALTWDGILPKGVGAVGLDVRMLRRPEGRSRPSSGVGTRSTSGPSTTTTTSTAASSSGSTSSSPTVPATCFARWPRSG